jgi:NAD(P)-dependent dehydrogenase (short-subunit alcohol dehydrogenase family)
MVPRDRGVILQVGAGPTGPSMPLWAAWRAAKHAIKEFIASLRTELINDQSRVRLTAVHLPGVEGPPLEWASRLPRASAPRPRLIQPEVAARAIVYAAEHDVGRDVVVGMSGGARPSVPAGGRREGHVTTRRRTRRAFGLKNLRLARRVVRRWARSRRRRSD